MMRRLLLLAAFLLLPSLAYSQTSTVTGHVNFPSGGASSNASVCFSLSNFKPNVPKVSGTGIIVQATNFCITPAADGSFSTSIYRNDQITPGSTYWRVDYLWNGSQQSSANYSIAAATFNLDSATPLVVTPLPANGLLTSSYNCQIASALSTWTCVHGFNDKNVTVTVYDANGNQIFPNTLTLTDANTVTLTWVTPQAGNAVIIHASAVAIAISQPNAVLQAPSGSQTINSSQALIINAATAHTGNNTHSGTETFTGSVLCKNLAGVRCIDQANSAGWAGADIGAWINSAYADLPLSGGHIKIGTLTSCVSFSTPIVFNTNLKPVQLEGEPGTATCLRYTPTTGAAINLDFGVHEPQNTGIKNIQLMGPGQSQTATAIQCGPTNGCEGATIEGLKISGFAGDTANGFGTIISLQGNELSFLVTIKDSQLVSSGTALSIPTPQENVRLYNGLIARNTTGVNVATVGTDLKIYGTSIDDNTTGFSITGGTLMCYGCHYENAGLGSAQYVTVSGGVFEDVGGQMVDDRTSSTNPQMVSASGASYVEMLGTFVTSLGITVTQAVNFSGTSHGWLNFTVGSTNISADYNTAYGGTVVDLPITATASGSNTWLLNQLALKLTGAAGTTGLLSPIPLMASLGTQPYNITVTGAAAPRTWSIADTLMTVWGGLATGTAGGFDLGTSALPWGNLWFGTAATNNFKFQPAATSGARIITIADPLSPTTVGLPLTIASGTSTLTVNAALAAVTSQAAITTAGTGILTTDVITWSYASAPTAGDSLCHVSPYVTAGNVNFVRTNPTAAAQSVSAIVINWKVVR